MIVVFPIIYLYYKFGFMKPLLFQSWHSCLNQGPYLVLLCVCQIVRFINPPWLLFSGFIMMDTCVVKPHGVCSIMADTLSVA